jgi:excisionase family DNA binding protein
MTASIEPLLTREEAAELLGISVSSVKRQIRKRNLRTKRLGKLVRIEPADLRDFINRCPDAVAETVGTPFLPGLFGPDLRK